MEQKFIAIREDEYNSFKHGEYEREIKKLKEEIEKLKKEKEDALMAKGTIVEITSSFCHYDTIKTLKILTDENFENGILDAIKNTEFEHIVNNPTLILSDFDKEQDYIIVGETYYYKNKWCEKLKSEIQSLSYKVKSLEEKRDELKSEINLLENESEIKDLHNGRRLDRDETILKKIINKFAK